MSTPPPQDDSVGAIVAARVGAITAAAERAAVAVNEGLEAQRRDAEAQVARYLAESRARADAAVEDRIRALEALTREVAARAEQSVRDLEALITALRATQANVGAPQVAPPPWPSAQVPIAGVSASAAGPPPLHPAPPTAAEARHPYPPEPPQPAYRTDLPQHPAPPTAAEAPTAPPEPPDAPPIVPLDWTQPGS